MCELFGISAKTAAAHNEILKDFFSHSSGHPHGWGLAILDQNDAEIVKEPMQASRSFYLHERLTVPVKGKTLLAHIRYATIGNIEYRNCHPFTGKDESGRRWTMIHNGTIFDFPPIAKYVKKQQGDTDSERIFLYILDQINKEIRSGKKMTGKERCKLLDEMVCQMAKGNKLNLLIYDGELLYVHTNYENSLYVLQEQEMAKFSTTPLGKEDWDHVPMTTLLAYHEGQKIFTGTNHGNAYLDNQKDLDYLYQIFANL